MDGKNKEQKKAHVVKAVSPKDFDQPLK